MKVRPRWCLAILLMMAGLANVAWGDDSWIGRRVFTRYGTVLKLGNRVLDDEGRAASLASSGTARREVRIYRVEHVDGDWLWLRGEVSGISGWVRTRYVIPREQAVDYYTRKLRENPSSYSYVDRGFIWMDKGELDIAIADYNEAIRLDPDSALAYCNRGIAWYKKKDYDKAIADYTEAIRIDPKFDMAYNNRGLAWANKAEYDKAIADYNETIRLRPRDDLAYDNRGNAWVNKKEDDKAIADYNEAIRINPTRLSAYNNRGDVWETRKDYDKAIADYNEAIRIDPKSALAYANRGYVRADKKEYDRAIADYNEAIRIDPTLAWAYRSRSSAWSRSKEPFNALADLNEAIRLDPKFAWSHNARAWIWATSRDPKIRDGGRAVESARIACELDYWKKADDLNTLAAAYAEAGDFDKAVEWQERANKHLDDEKAKKKGEDRLKLYRDKKPYRDEG